MKLLLALALATSLCVAGPAVEPPRELRIARGQKSVTVHDSVVRASTQRWRFSARAGQQAQFRLSSLERNAVFEVWMPGWKLLPLPDDQVLGEHLPGASTADEVTRWEGALPVTGEYLVEVTGTRGNASYRFTLKIDP